MKEEYVPGGIHRINAGVSIPFPWPLAQKQNIQCGTAKRRPREVRDDETEETLAQMDETGTAFRSS